MGTEQIILVGYCGGLDRGVGYGTVLIVKSATEEDGASRAHADGTELSGDHALVARATALCARRDLSHATGCQRALRVQRRARRRRAHRRLRWRLDPRRRGPRRRCRGVRRRCRHDGRAATRSPSTNRPSNHTPDVHEAIGATIRIRATSERHKPRRTSRARSASSPRRSRLSSSRRAAPGAIKRGASSASFSTLGQDHESSAEVRPKGIVAHRPLHPRSRGPPAHAALGHSVLADRLLPRRGEEGLNATRLQALDNVACPGRSIVRPHLPLERHALEDERAIHDDYLLGRYPTQNLHVAVERRTALNRSHLVLSGRVLHEYEGLPIDQPNGLP